MFLLNYVAIAGRNLTVDNLKQKLEPYIIDTESQLCESLRDSPILPDDVLDISMYLKFVNRENEIKQLIENMKNLYDLIENLKSYAEPKKQIAFLVAVGTSGKGKTTFARKAYENKDLYIKVISNELKMILD